VRQLGVLYLHLVGFVLGDMLLLSSNVVFLFYLSIVFSLSIATLPAPQMRGCNRAAAMDINLFLKILLPPLLV
jgi:hypothetical protein